MDYAFVATPQIVFGHSGDEDRRWAQGLQQRRHRTAVRERRRAPVSGTGMDAMAIKSEIWLVAEEGDRPHPLH